MGLESHIFRKTLLLLAAVVAWIVAAPASSSAQTLAEALDTTNLVWTTGGDVPWFAQTTNTHDGVDAVRSGVVGSNETSWIETTVVGPGAVSFWTVTQSPILAHFSTSFTINGLSPGGFLAEVFPFNVWHKQTNDLYEGTNVLRWSTFAIHGSGGGGFSTLDEFAVGPARPLAITYQPAAATVYPGEWILMSVGAEGTPPYQYQWLKDGTNIAGATNAWLFSFDEATTNDAGVYCVIVSNAHESVTSSNAVVTILPPTAPSFTYEPVSVTVYSGQGVTFSGAVKGSPPFTFLWSKNGTLVLEQTITGPFGNPSSSLLLTNVSQADEGNYSLVVTNGVGSLESSNAMLTVIPSVAPVIMRHPRSLEVAAGVNTWMSVEATGTPDPCHVWTKVNDLPPPPDPPLPIVCQSPRHSFNNVTTNDAGIYFVTASNPGGEVTSRDALLTVLPPIVGVGSWWQGAYDIFVTNGLAFLAQGSEGLAILNVNNPAAPVMLGGYNTPGSASAVYVSDGLAFVADDSAGLQIINVTNPFAPFLVGTYNTPGYASDVVVRSNLAFVADGRAGLLILKVGNPAFPSVAGSYLTNFSADHVCLSGNHAIITSPYPEILPGTNVAGLFVIDISDPAHPTEVGRLPLGFGRLDVGNELVFGIAANGNGLKVLTITNPVQPTVIGTFSSYPSTNFPPPLGIPASDVRVVNDVAYVAGNSGGQSRLYVLDMRDPTEPIPVGYYTNSGQPDNLWADGNLVYVTGVDSTVEIVQTPFNTGPVGPPMLSLSTQAGLKLGIHGRRGLHYDIEYAGGLAGYPWQTLQTILLTNENAVIEMPSDSTTRFFRLKQLD